MGERQYALVREIVMGPADEDWLFARTVIPQVTLRRGGRRFRLLRNRPLGHKLFGRVAAQRMQMSLWFAPVTIGSAARLIGQPQATLWQRQSLFTIGGSPLMINEVFLPACPVYTELGLSLGKPA